ncbi:ribokinase [Metabacillus malikii]|uniref:Ribokinase n=1 Tax=Metabacillus malikii TaxID=1504265 RepID=A0ABT9ZHU3_9BACI|nr:ribokinase [Metabacillus malikii]MDQ0231469.1 ribokinase [Metabacillus malikii]
MKRPKITVIGSINMDLITKTTTIPKIGETVLGQSFHTIPGGKGANQAVAAARLGADITLIGCVGNDEFGKTLKEHLLNEHINTTYINSVEDTSTGIASITVANGDNSIIVAPGANYQLTVSHVRSLEHVIANSDMILLQLEIPLETVEEAVRLSAKHQVPVILNPAPIQKLSRNLLTQVNYITPNEHEQHELLSLLNSDELEQIRQKCIVTKGASGVAIHQNGAEQLIPSYKVDVVDTTGAGDTFNGALAVALSSGKSLNEACHFANAAASLSVTKLGAQSGMPTLDEVQQFMGDSPPL